MKLIALAIALSLGSAWANPNWTNVVEATSAPSRSIATAIRSGSAGQYYVGGTLTTETSDFLLLRADQFGRERWRVTYNGTNGGSESLRALAVDPAGSAYAIGRSSGAGGIAEIAVLKCTAKGVQKWVARHRDAGERSLEPTSAAVDPAGNVYVVALRQAEDASLDQLLYRFSTRGQLQWIQTNAHGLAPGHARASVVADGAKAVYLVGMPSPSLVSLTRYLSTGALGWRTFHPGELPTDGSASAAVDAAGNLHVVSSLRVDADRPEDARVDVQVEKVTRKGSVAWRARHRGVTSATLTPSGLALEKSGNVSVYGLEQRYSTPDNDDLFVVCWDRLGRERWSAWHSAGSGPETTVAATARSQGGLAVLLNNAPFNEVTALVFDANGNRRWLERSDLHFATRGLAAPAPDTLVAVADVTDENEVPGIVLVGYSVPKESTLKLIRVPQARAVAENAATTFEVTARGSGELTYRWWRDNEPLSELIPDADRPSLNISSIKAQDAGEYAVEVSNGENTVRSPSARLSLLQAPRFVSNPSNQDLPVGTLTWLSAGVDGSEPMYLQWLHNGTNIPGAHEPFLVIPSVSIGDAGTYELMASNALGFTVSAPARLDSLRTGGLDTWSWIEPYPQGNTMDGIAFGAGRFVAITRGSTLVSSSNGATWQVSPPFPHETLNAITWTGERFVVVGGDDQGNAIIRVSGDGLSWASQAHRSSNALFRVTSGGGIIVAATSGGTFFRSTNGTDWLQFTPGLNPTALGYGNGLFVAAGNLPLVFTSPDGLTWTTHGLPAPVVASDIAYGNGRFVVAGLTTGVMAVSSTGNDWTVVSYGTSATLTGITFANGEFVAVSHGGNSYASVNGLIWYEQSIGPTAIYDVAYGNGLFTCVGAQGGIYTSPNPGFWTPHSIGGGEGKYRKVHSVGEVTVVVGDDAAVLSSIGGGSFIPCAVSTVENLHGVTYGAGLWVAVGNNGAIEASLDAVVWNDVDSFVTNDLRSVTFGNGRFVLVGEGGLILTSRDGRDWRPRPSGTPNGLRAVLYGGGNFVAVGEFGTLLASDDGEKWRVQDISTRKEITSVCFGNGLWVAAVDNGEVWRSTNRTSWSVVDTVYKNLTGLTYRNGLFVMLASGVVLSSRDGQDWEPHFHGSMAELRDLAFENERVIGVGSDQTIVISEPLQ